jgi:methylmalonyl-CoA mutase
MTINATASPLLAMYTNVVAARGQGIRRDQVSGTIQNDILKNTSRGTHIYPPEPSRRWSRYSGSARPKSQLELISISGYHIHEAGRQPFRAGIHVA